MSDWWNRVYLGSCERMAEVPDGSIQTCDPSPPYYGLRDYGVDGQIGVEPTIGEYVERLVAVFREVRRTLRDDGTLWLNLGDSYAGSPRGNPDRVSTSSLTNPAGHASAIARGDFDKVRASGLKPKDLIGIPWRVAFALQADGWWLRDAIIWAKPNPMPSSVDDRCTPSYETVFMLAKSARYFADMDAVRTPIEPGSIGKRTKIPDGWGVGDQPRDVRAFSSEVSREEIKATRYKHDEARRTSQQSPNRIWDDPEAVERIAAAGANLRNVWTIATQAFSDAHFATFPIELPLRCIRIGSREGDVVLDPFMGSGTVAQAAESIGRRWVGYELNPEYHALIAERTRQIGLL